MNIKIRVVLVVLVLFATSCAWADSLAVSMRGEDVVNLYSIGGGGSGLQLATSIPVGKRPTEMCLAPNAKRLFVSLVGEKSIAVIDLDSKTVVAKLTDPGIVVPDGCAVSPDSKKLYSIDQDGGAVFVFSIDSKQMVKKITVGKEPRRVIFSPDGKKVLVTNAQSDNISVIDPATDTVVSTLKTGNEPRDLAYSPDGKLLAVGLINDDSTEFFKADTLEFRQQVASSWSPQHLEFAPDGQHLYILGHILNQVVSMKVGKLARTENLIPVPAGAVGNAGLWGLAMTPDGKYLYVSNTPDGTLTSLDATTLRVARTVAAGKQPLALIYIKPKGGITDLNAAARLARYRVLAQQAMDAVKKNDLAAADKLCRTLEQEFDDGEVALRKSSPDVWGQIDEAMDDFIHPIMRAGGKQPDPAALNTVYQNFLAKLKLLG